MQAGEAGPTRASWRVSLLAGVLFGLVGLGIAAFGGLEVNTLDGWAQGQVTWLTLFAGVFICGGIAWGSLAARRPSPSALLGAAAGALTAILSYPVVMMLAEITHIASVGAGGLGGRLLHMLQVAGLLIVATGLLPIVIMALVGALLPALLRGRGQPGTAREVFWLRRGLVVGGAVLLVLAAAFTVFIALPPNAGALDRLPAPAPVADYDAALAGIGAVNAAEAQLPLEARCPSRLLTHGAKTAVVVVYLHGLTTCPAQGDALAQQLFDAGYNVYLPRFPGHGEADRFTKALVGVSAEDMVQTAAHAVDIAHGLGDRVIVAGLSGGGTVAMWLAQNRGDISRTVAMAPFLTPYGLPQWTNRAAMNLLLVLPNIMVLWDPEDSAATPGMEYAYPQIPTRLVAQFLRLGELLKDRAARSAPQSMVSGLLLNDADNSVNNTPAATVAADWQARGATVDLRTIPGVEAMPHDFIDPRQPDARIDAVYPLIIEMITGQAAATGGK